MQIPYILSDFSAIVPMKTSYRTNKHPGAKKFTIEAKYRNNSIKFLGLEVQNTLLEMTFKNTHNILVHVLISYSINIGFSVIDAQ